MRADRAAAGLSGAAILVVLGVAPGASTALTAVLLAAAGTVIIGTLAPALPILHRLPVVGAPRVELRVTLEAKKAPEVGPRPAIRVLRVGIVNDGPGELRRPRLQVLVPVPITIYACDGFGEPDSEGRGQRMPDTSERLLPQRDSAFWAERTDDLDEDSLLKHYLLYGIPAGRWVARVKLASASLYRKRELIEDVAFDVYETEDPNLAPDRDL